ncbi:hypothetical protein BDZ85DRAFT_133824 [Elsinoe ampelina]|uniref:Rhodopsin domain-containing protein n=1 Tax=Elsinoe ampelina TaxID=302913 RepID=A0A6A6G8C9_9PEZI|nr:hypothetical protein BDZ85DRAFT_133824 [Elsinoe ampelina]
MDPAQIATCICLPLGIVLIFTRTALRLFRQQAITWGDYWCLAAAVFIFVRLITNVFLLRYGSTRTLDDEERSFILPGSQKYYEITTGSKITLISRTMMNCLLWSLKMAILDVVFKLIRKLRFEKLVYWGFIVVLGATWVAAMLGTFLGCTPISLYWQIYPNPGRCAVGDSWLLSYEIGNMLTDFMLLAVPIHLILSAKISFRHRLRLIFVFSLGAFLIAISVVRMMQGFGSKVQVSRTMWASIEIFFAVSVAVSPTIYALVHSRGESSTDYPSKTNGGSTWIKGTVLSALKSRNGAATAAGTVAGKETPEDLEMKGGITVTRTMQTRHEGGSEENLYEPGRFEYGERV